jgi:uroporphyrinogen-III synthase
MRVLVTRPEPSASETARRLAALGHEPAVLPLTETRTLPVAEIPDAAQFDAVVATSSAALRHAPAGLCALFADLPLYAVGERTAQAAAQAGFRWIQSGGGDAVALARYISATVPAGSRLLYLCGRLRTGALAERLEQAGFAARVLEVYDTTAVEQARDVAVGVLAGARIDAALVYSAYGAAMLSQVAARPEIAPLLDGARILCISARAADALSPDMLARARIAGTPDEAGLFALLAAAG